MTEIQFKHDAPKTTKEEPKLTFTESNGVFKTFITDKDGKLVRLPSELPTPQRTRPSQVITRQGAKHK